jgi:ribosomal protein S18 acetylase RimI-like enzyme
MSVRVESHTGSRSELRPLFEEAEDSAAQLDSYLDAGQVLVAVAGDQIVGHLQLVDGSDSQQAEIKNMAVDTSFRGRGIGRTLIRAAVELALAQRRSRLVVATAAADIGNLRFYQPPASACARSSATRLRQTPATRWRRSSTGSSDRVWLDRDLGVDER